MGRTAARPGDLALGQRRSRLLRGRRGLRRRGRRSRLRFDDLASGWANDGHTLGFGVGIATGEVTLGRIGFEGRYDYGMVGTTVIVASRLSSAAGPGQILLSPWAAEAVEGLVEVEPVGEIVLKGFSKPLAAVNVLALAGGREALMAGVEAG